MVDVFIGALMVEVFVLGVTGAFSLETDNSAEGAEVGGFDVALVFGLSMAGLMLLDAETNNPDKEGTDEDLDGVDGFGTLLAALLDAADDGTDERLVGAEGEADTGRLVTRVLDRAGGEASADVLFVEILEIDVKPGVVNVEGLDDIADAGDE